MRLGSGRAVEESRRLGCTLSRGYFLAGPEIVPGREVPANRLTQLRILSQVTRPDISISRIERLIKHDVSLIRTVAVHQSAALGWKREISPPSTRHW
jgi:c-di-GMP-related signal transduction protein